jgi:3-deoxy-D-manno-octulosonate 8-phosphate phosphatase (KDO 8-P phosphatase)
MSIRASDHFSPLLAPGARSTLSVGELIRRAEHASWLLCDVDGVLTDGRLYFDDNNVPLVSFDIKDGLGLKLAQAAGLKVGLLSGRRSPAAERRAADLGLDLAWFGRPEKGPAFAEMLAEQRVKAEQVIYVGDDLPDLALFGLVGVAAAPADAVAEVQAKAHLVLAHAGGRGAVRELVELLLRARGSWDSVVARFAGH